MKILLKNRRRWFMVVVALAAMLTFTGMSLGVWNAPARLTDNNVDDSQPDISGNNMVWQTFDGDYEIVFHNGSVATTLTSNGWHDMGPKLDGNQAVWTAMVGDYEIFHYDGSETTALTDNAVSDTNPDISGNNIVWEHFDGGDFEIMKYDGATETAITNNTIEDYLPRISGNNIAWFARDVTDWEIMFYNGSTVATLTANELPDTEPRISGNNVVWTRNDGSDREIIYYNGSVETTLTSNTVDDITPVISGSNIAWESDVPGNSEIMFYNGSMATTISIGTGNDQNPEISGNKVVWAAQNGLNRDVYVFDGAGTHLISTPDLANSPNISGNQLAWYTASAPNSEIYKYSFDFTNPGDPGVTSALPPKNVWTNDNTLLANFSGGSDPISGIDGFSVTWTGAPLTLPDAVKDLEESAGWALSPAQPDGDRYFHLRTRDNGGNWTSTIHYGPFKIDTTKPTASVRAPANVSASGTTARFRVSWRGSDAASGVKNYDVQYKIGAGGAWKRWKRAVTAVRGRFTGEAGKTYFFRARARDKAGNLGAWSRRRRTVVF